MTPQSGFGALHLPALWVSWGPLGVEMCIRLFIAVSVLVLAACSQEKKEKRSPPVGEGERPKAQLLVAVPPTPAAAPLRISNDVTAPVVIKRVDLPMPTRMEATGPLVLEMVIGKTGRARDVRVLRDGTSPRLGTAYVKALEDWRFQPGTLKGKPVDVVFNLSVHIDVR